MDSCALACVCDRVGVLLCVERSRSCLASACHAYTHTHTHTHTHIGLHILHAIEKKRGTLQFMHDHVHVLLHCSYLPVSCL